METKTWEIGIERTTVYCCRVQADSENAALALVQAAVDAVEITDLMLDSIVCQPEDAIRVGDAIVIQGNCWGGMRVVPVGQPSTDPTK